MSNEFTTQPVHLNVRRTKADVRAGLVDRKIVESPQEFYCWPPQVALLFWFFRDFRCGVLLFIVILFIYKLVLNVRQAGDSLYGKLLFTWLLLVMSSMVEGFSTYSS